MKPKYEKPKMIDLDVPMAWGGDYISRGTCRMGDGVGDPTGTCLAGRNPTISGQCFTGGVDGSCKPGSGGGIDFCASGIGV